jgi:hypothetical protein
VKLASPESAGGGLGLVQLRNLLRSRDGLDQGEMLSKHVTLIDVCGSVSAHTHTHIHIHIYTALRQPVIGRNRN